MAGGEQQYELVHMLLEKSSPAILLANFDKFHFRNSPVSEIMAIFNSLKYYMVGALYD